MTKIPCATPGCEVLVRHGRCTRHRQAAWEAANLGRVRERQRLRKKLRPFARRCVDCGEPCDGVERCGRCIGRFNGRLGAGKPRKRRANGREHGDSV